MFINYINSVLDLPIFESKYLEKKNVSYYDHFTIMFTCAINSFTAGFFLLIHAFIPDYFIHSGSQIIDVLNLTLQERYESKCK